MTEISTTVLCSFKQNDGTNWDILVQLVFGDIITIINNNISYSRWAIIKMFKFN